MEEVLSTSKEIEIEEEFFSQFGYERCCGESRKVGVEVEYFFVDPVSHRSVNAILEFLREADKHIWGSCYTHEFFQHQLEIKSPPFRDLSALICGLSALIDEAEDIAKDINVSLTDESAWLGTIPSPQVYPDRRYKDFKEEQPSKLNDACCRVSGVHIHVGITNGWLEALEVYNRLVSNLDILKEIGKETNYGSDRIRIFEEKIYSLKGLSIEPPKYNCKEDVLRHAKKEDWFHDMSENWSWIRLNQETVEVRTFGATKDVEKIVRWVEEVLNIAEVELG